jgi:hypothetical protein
MFGSSIGPIVTIALALIGWGARLETKVSLNRQQHDDLLKLIDARFDTMIVRFDNFDKRMERVERHVLNGSYRKEE